MPKWETNVCASPCGCILFLKNGFLNYTWKSCYQISSTPSLLVQLSHHNLRGNYHHTEPEEAYESGIHSVNRPSHLRIVWLEYLTFLRQNVERRKNSQTAFKAFSDCVYRCLVVMDTKQAPPTSLTGQSMNYHDHTFQEQVFTHLA